MPNSFLRKHSLLSAGAFLVLAGVVWGIYSQGLTTPFIYDDPTCIKDNPSIVRLWPLVGGPRDPGPLNPPKDLPTSGRPLVNLTLALNYRFGGLNPSGYHAFNVMVHLLATLLLGLIVARILRLDCFEGRFTGVSGPLAFLTTLLWAVHPLNTETVIYVTQRTELMVGLFYLATVYGSLRYWAAETTTGRSSWLIFASLACLAGMACKEVMVSAPVVVLLIERTLVTGSFRQALRRSWPLYAGLLLGWLLLLGLNYKGPRSASAGFHLEVPFYVWWFTQAKVLWLYLKLVVWPWPLRIHYQAPYLETFGAAWPWVLVTATLIIGVVVLLWRRKVVGLVGAWVLLILAPTLIVPIVTEVAAERRMYLPLAGIIALAVAGSYWLLQRLGATASATKRAKEAGRTKLTIITATAVTLALIWSVVDVRRLDAFHDALKLWQDTLYFQPDDGVANNNLGLELLNLGRASEAISPLKKALQFDPNHLEARVNLGTAFMKTGRMQEAMEQFQQVVEADPENAPARCDLGIVLGKLGRHQEAIEQLQMASKIAPSNSLVLNNLGLALVKVERLPDAIEQFRRALEIDPNYFEARLNLGTALGTINRPEEAVQEFKRALKLKPKDARIYFNLAMTYEMLERSDEAIASAQTALELAR
ncbi:MAG TPA: tetratricopeptide repeat protein, partial [Pirellulales bacterium]